MENPAGSAPGSFFVSSNNPAFPSGTPYSGALTFASSNPLSCQTLNYAGNTTMTGNLTLGFAPA